MKILNQLFFAVSALAFSGIGLAQAVSGKGANEIVVMTTGGTLEAAQKAALYEPFTKATGIKVVLITVDPAKVLVSIDRGDAPEVDVIQVNAARAALYERRNALEKIDYKYFDPDTIAGMAQSYRQPFTVGQITYSLGLAYSEDAVKGKRPPATWAEFFDPKAIPGARAMAPCEAGWILDGGVMEIALMADGVPADKLYPLDVDRAFRKLEAFKPNVSVFYGSAGDGPQSLIDGRADFAATFNGRIYTVRNQGAKVNFNWNQSLIQTNFWAVMHKSPNRDNAMKFLAFASRAQPQSIISNMMAYGPTNDKAFALIKSDLRPWLPGSPENVAKQVRQDYTWWKESGSDGKSNFERVAERCPRLMAK